LPRQAPDKHKKRLKNRHLVGPSPARPSSPRRWASSTLRCSRSRWTRPRARDSDGPPSRRCPGCENGLFFLSLFSCVCACPEPVLANHPFQTRTRELQKRLKTSAVSFAFLFFAGCALPQRQDPPLPRRRAGKKRHLLRCHFILQMIALPRQDRNKRRESTQHRDAFSCRC
jgi:hypothetical protein